jgi:hypothetical protein
MNQVYLDTARLLTRIAPLVLVDDTFALKGGTQSQFRSGKPAVRRLYCFRTVLGRPSDNPRRCRGLGMAGIRPG